MKVITSNECFYCAPETEIIATDIENIICSSPSDGGTEGTEEGEEL